MFYRIQTDNGKTKKVFAGVATEKAPELVSNYREKVLKEEGTELPQAMTKEKEEEKKKNKKRKREEHKKEIDELKDKLIRKTLEMEEMKQQLEKQLSEKCKEEEDTKQLLEKEIATRTELEANLINFQTLQTNAQYSLFNVMAQYNAQQEKMVRLEEIVRNIQKVCGSEKNIKMLNSFASCITNGIIPLCEFMGEKEQSISLNEDLTPSAFLQNETIDTGIHTPQNGITNLT